MANWIYKVEDEDEDVWLARAFKTCGISNAMDGTEDYMLWEDDLTTKDENAENGEAEEPNPYDDKLSAEDFNWRFGESDNEDFEGF